MTTRHRYYRDTRNGLYRPTHKTHARVMADLDHPHCRDCVAWWPCREAHGDSLEDLIGGYTGTRSDANWAAAPQGWVPDYSTTYAAMGDVLDFAHDDPFSILVRFRTNTNANMMLVSKQESSGNYRGYYLYLPTSGAGHGFIVALRNDNSPANVIDVRISTKVFDVGTWYHLAMTYDGSTNASGVACYCDGVAQTLTVQSDNLTATMLNAAPFNIGSRNSGNLSFDGQIDDVRVFDRALTQAEVISLAGATTAALKPMDYTRPRILQTQAGAVVLSTASASHGLTSDNLALTQAHTLAVQDTLHGLMSDTAALTQAHTLAIQEALHAHASDNLDLDITLTLLIADAAHGHIADNLDLVQANVLAIVDAAHAHLADTPGLITETTLIVSDALHAHLSDNLALVIGGLEIPETGDILVPAENRLIIVAAERRVIKVH